MNAFIFLSTLDHQLQQNVEEEEMGVTLSDGGEEEAPAGLQQLLDTFPSVRSKRKGVAGEKRMGFAVSHENGQLLKLSASFSSVQSRLWRERNAGDPTTASS